STSMDTNEKLMPNNGQAVSQLEYSRVIGCLIYAMTCTRPNIAFVVGKLSMYTSNPGTQRWQAIQRGFKHKSRIDYFYTYAPVARISTIRLMIAMVSIHNLIIHQMDVKIPFLNGDLEEEVYMNQPHGFIMLGNEIKVCKLIKSLYGLKQAPK
nr:zinc finger, CCHC-type [Tanacetum cinerariifolium]